MSLVWTTCPGNNKAAIASRTITLYSPEAVIAVYLLIMLFPAS